MTDYWRGANTEEHDSSSTGSSWRYDGDPMGPVEGRHFRYGSDTDASVWQGRQWPYAQQPEPDDWSWWQAQQAPPRMMPGRGYARMPRPGYGYDVGDPYDPRFQGPWAGGEVDEGTWSGPAVNRGARPAQNGGLLSSPLGIVLALAALTTVFATMTYLWHMYSMGDEMNMGNMNMNTPVTAAPATGSSGATGAPVVVPDPPDTSKGTDTTSAGGGGSSSR